MVSTSCSSRHSIMACVARIFKVYASLYVCRGQTVIELVQQKNAVTHCFGSRRWNLELAVWFLFFCFLMRRARVRCRRAWPKALFLYSANSANQNNANNHIVLQSHRVHRILQHQYAEPEKNTFYVFVDRIILLNFPQCNRKFAKKSIYSILNKVLTFPIFGCQQK